MLDGEHRLVLGMIIFCCVIYVLLTHAGGGKVCCEFISPTLSDKHCVFYSNIFLTPAGKNFFILVIMFAVYFISNSLTPSGDD
jgi:hypothetical protein